jgi:hypothetical protein
VLGYQHSTKFVEDGELIGVGMVHPAGGSWLAFRLDPEKAKVAAGFDYFAIGVPDESSLRELAAHFDELGEHHGGVHRASHGWILPYLHDPNGHEVRFYTIQEHTSHDPTQTMREEHASRF